MRFALVLALLVATPSVKLLEVRPGTPPLEIRILPGPESANVENVPPDRIRERHWIGRVEIARKGESKPFQRVEVLGYGSPRDLANSRFEDANSDGYADLLLGNEGGAKWEGFQILFYDPASGTFVQNALSREMSERLEGQDLEFRPGTQEIELTHLPFGCQEGFVTSETFDLQGGKLREMEERKETRAPEGCYEVTSQLRDGVLREVSRKRAPDLDREMGQK